MAAIETASASLGAMRHATEAAVTEPASPAAMDGRAGTVATIAITGEANIAAKRDAPMGRAPMGRARMHPAPRVPAPMRRAPMDRAMMATAVKAAQSGRTAPRAPRAVTAPRRRGRGSLPSAAIVESVAAVDVGVAAADAVTAARAPETGS